MFKKITAVMAAALMALGPAAALESFAVAGDSFDTATFIELNTQRTDNIATRTEEDFYRFSLDTAGVVSIEFSHDYVDTPDDVWSINIYDFNRDQIVYRKFIGSEKNAVNVCNLGLDKGDYFIDVNRGYQWSAADYRLKVNFKASDAWEKEINNAYDTATFIPVNKEINGTICEKDDNDKYRFKLDKAGVVNIDFSHGYMDTPDDAWRITVYDFNRDQIVYRKFTGSEKNVVSICSLGLDKGDYYIEIYRGYQWSDADYKFKVNYKATDAWEKEINNDYDTATLIPVNKDIKGTICEKNDYDKYRFKLEQAGVMKLDFSHGYVDTPDDVWRITVYDFDRNEIIYRKFIGCEKKSVSVCELGLDKGDYYIEVHCGYQWSDVNYKLKLNFNATDDWEKELNNDFDKATVIGLNKNYNGTIDETNDSDYYRFTLDKQQQITFGFKHGNADTPDNTWAVTVYDFNRNELGSTAYKGSSTKSDYSLKLNLPKGDYFVKVSPERKQSELPYILRIRDTKDKKGIGGDAMLGDVNGDESINVTDIAMIAAHIKGIKALDANGLAAADVNADGSINVTDIAMIAAHIKGIKALV